MYGWKRKRSCAAASSEHQVRQQRAAQHLLPAGRGGIDDGLRRVEVVAQRAALRVQRVEDAAGEPDQALCVRDQRSAIPGQEEGAIGRVPAAAPAAEEARFLREQANGTDSNTKRHT